MKNKYLLVFCFILFLFANSMILFASNLNGDQILAKSDSLLIPRKCRYRISVQERSLKDENYKKEYSFRGYKKGSEKNILVVIEPASIKGIVHLRRGDNIWTYYPSIGQTIRMAYQAVFMNTTLNYGDVISTELTRDYTAEIIGQENVRGKNCFKLVLTPKKDTQGYAKIITWIDKKTFFPVKREYYSLAGLLLKNLIFSKIEFKNNILFKVTQIYTEFLTKKETTVIYSNIKQQVNIADRFFNPQTIRYIKN